jgi:broad specificity phosphatase PhoE
VADPPRLSGVEGSLALIRHGESTAVAENRFQGQLDYPLSGRGLEQAALVAARLADPTATPSLPLPAGAPIGVWHSTLERAAQTARLVAGARSPATPAHPADGLVELAQGQWEGLLHSEVTARFGSELAAWRADPVHHYAPGGESLEQGRVRVVAVVDEILEALHSSAAVPASATDPVLGYASTATAWPWAIVVAHDGIFRLLLMALLGIPLREYWSFPFALCAVSIVEINAGRARLRSHNLAEHLDSLARPALAGTDRGGAL